MPKPGKLYRQLDLVKHRGFKSPDGVGILTMVKFLWRSLLQFFAHNQMRETDIPLGRVRFRLVVTLGLVL